MDLVYPDDQALVRDLKRRLRVPYTKVVLTRPGDEHVEHSCTRFSGHI